MKTVVPEFVGRRQRKIVLHGVKYKAKAQYGCYGCAFGVVSRCVQPVTPSGGTLCGIACRTDATSIIWIKED